MISEVIKLGWSKWSMFTFHSAETGLFSLALLGESAKFDRKDSEEKGGLKFIE